MSNKFKIYVTYKNEWNLSEYENQLEIESNKEETLTRDEFLKQIKGCHGIISNPRCGKIDAEVLDAAGNQLKVISTTSAGYNYIDIAECTKRGIVVGFLPATFRDAVAEYAIGLTLAVSRKIVEGANLANKLDWNHMDSVQLLRGKPIRGSTIGIFGMGRIGLAVAKRFNAFEVKNIIYSDVYENAEALKLNFQLVSFEKLLNESDYLICCASLTNNEKIFNRSAFEKMKSSSIFVNVARGAMVDHDDLAYVLQNKIIYAAGIDVTAPEPLPNDHLLYTLSNCVVTPHIAGDDEITRYELFKVGFENLINGLTNKPLVYQAK